MNVAQCKVPWLSGSWVYVCVLLLSASLMKTHTFVKMCQLVRAIFICRRLTCAQRGCGVMQTDPDPDLDPNPDWDLAPVWSGSVRWPTLNHPIREHKQSPCSCSLVTCWPAVYHHHGDPGLSAVTGVTAEAGSQGRSHTLSWSSAPSANWTWFHRSFKSDPFSVMFFYYTGLWCWF